MSEADPERELLVTVRDESGGPIRANAIYLVDEHDERALTLERGEAGWSQVIERLEPATYGLVLDLPSRPKLRFRVRLRERRGARVLDFPGPDPRCCRLRHEPDHRFELAIQLGATHHEVVFVAGWDYSGGANNARFCDSWRDDLYAGETWISGEATPLTKTIFDHTVVTLFDFKSGDRIQMIKGERGWHEMDRRLQGTVPTYLGPYKKEESKRRRHEDDSLSIVHVYEHITKLGERCPGSLAGFHIFSHAWAGGPILVNTDQTPRYSHSRQRDPGDKDGRTKDFSSTNMPKLEHFAAAFAKGAIAKVWGCYATTLYRRMIRAAARARARGKGDRPLCIRTNRRTVYKMTAEEIEERFRETIIGSSYMARLGRATGVAVYGAPPGMGANLERIHGHHYMLVRRGVYDLEYGWCTEVLGLEPDISGHFAYTRAAETLELQVS